MNTSQNQDNSEQPVHKVTMERTPIAPYKSCPRRTRRDESSKQRHYSMPLRWATLRTTCHTRWHRNRSSHRNSRNSNPRYCSTVLRPPRPTTPDSTHQEFQNTKMRQLPSSKVGKLEPPSWRDFPQQTRARMGQRALEQHQLSQNIVIDESTSDT